MFKGLAPTIVMAGEQCSDQKPKMVLLCADIPAVKRHCTDVHRNDSECLYPQSWQRLPWHLTELQVDHWRVVPGNPDASLSYTVRGNGVDALRD